LLKHHDAPRKLPAVSAMEPKDRFAYPLMSTIWRNLKPSDPKETDDPLFHGAIPRYIALLYFSQLYPHSSTKM